MGTVAAFLWSRPVVPELTIDTQVLEFGPIAEGQTITKTAKLRNSGGELLRILAVEPSCGCTAVNVSKRALKAGEYSDLDVTIQGSGDLGTGEVAFVSVISNDPEAPERRISIRCVSGPEVIVRPAVLDLSRNREEEVKVEAIISVLLPQGAGNPHWRSGGLL